MSNDLVKVEDLQDLPLQKYDDKAFELAQSSASYLPRLQLLTSNSDKCKSGEFPTNHYALINDQKFDDLGVNVDCLPVAWRPKALETGDEVISVYDPNDAEFARIQERSLNETNSGCMFGPEFLVWLPGVKRFATFFMGTKSARRESSALKDRLQKGVTLGSQKIETKKFTWFAPKVSACSTPFEMPSRDALIEAVEGFNNPPKSEVEKVSSSDDRAR